MFHKVFLQSITLLVVARDVNRVIFVSSFSATRSSIRDGRISSSLPLSSLRNEYKPTSTSTTRCIPSSTKSSRIRSPRSFSSLYSFSPLQNEEQEIIETEAEAISVEVEVEGGVQNQKIEGKPKWMKCINGVAPKTGPLNEIVSMLSKIHADGDNDSDGDNDNFVSLQRANELIAMGAVWARMDAPTPEELLDQYSSSSNDSNNNANLQYGDLPKGWKNQYSNDDTSYISDDGTENGSDSEQDLDAYIAAMESRRYNRIMTPSIITQGTDVRIYPHPRRFSSCAELASRETSLLHEDTTFVIVNKPPMLPTQPDASNYHENCPGCVGRYLGPFTSLSGDVVHRPLLCHRVDACVGGCVVLSKDVNGQAVFTNFQRERKVKKVYLALTTKEVPVGMHVHWMWAEMNKRGGSGGPPCQLVSHTVPLNRKKAKSWTRCILEVVKCEPIDVDVNNRYGYNPNENGTVQHYQSTIRLVTGRKHQVRTMLSSLGCPIVRDTLYEPIAGMTLDLLFGGGEGAMIMDMAIEQCRVPQEPIGLQAHAILFGGIRARAGTPWWGDGSGAGTGTGTGDVEGASN